MSTWERLDAYQRAWAAVETAEADLVDATGSERREAMRRLDEARRAYHTLRMGETAVAA